VTSASITPKIGRSIYTRLKWLQRHEIDSGTRTGVNTEERENKELRRADKILKSASAFFRPGGAGAAN